MTASAARVRVDPEGARVFEHGWQSWSPTTTYPVAATSHRPSRPVLQTMCWRPDRPPPDEGFQGEGLLAVDPGDGESVHLFAAPDVHEVPSIRARLDGQHLVVEADGEVDQLISPGPLDSALSAWAEGFAERTGVPAAVRPPPTVWCSWYAYFTRVAANDVLENLLVIDRLDLPVDVIQVDDGWQAEIGDWAGWSPRFGALDELVADIRDTGRRAGIWVAPFLVGERSQLRHDHPGWLLAGTDAGHNWGQQQFALDLTQPAVTDHLRRAFVTLREMGIDYFKLDFAYAGAFSGIAAYRHALGVIRDAVGPDAYLVGCGAPILPTVGLVDAMRVGPDIDVQVHPVDGDMSRPSLRAAALSVVGRAWQNGRFWVNDPDCLLARPEMPHRAQWASLVERYGGLRASGDRIADLDAWGLATTRRVLGA